jgi:uncharacterized protein (DUF4415 family)
MDEQEKKGRGKGKKPALASTSIRLERSTIEFFKVRYGSGAQAQMRKVLADYVQGAQGVFPNM